jgi:hypothetical protein
MSETLKQIFNRCWNDETRVRSYAQCSSTPLGSLTL